MDLFDQFFFSPYIYEDHVTVSFARSGGPGGQNVNKGLYMSFCLLCGLDFFFF